MACWCLIVSHTGASTIMQQDDVIEFTIMFVLDLGIWLLKHVTVMVCTVIGVM